MTASFNIDLFRICGGGGAVSPGEKKRAGARNAGRSESAGSDLEVHGLVALFVLTKLIVVAGQDGIQDDADQRAHGQA